MHHAVAEIDVLAVKRERFPGRIPVTAKSPISVW